MASRSSPLLTKLYSLRDFLRLFQHLSGVISGAMLPIRRAFNLTPFQQEVVVSSTVLSAFFSSLAGGTLNNKSGRRVSILFAAAVFAIGSILLMVAINYHTLVLGRIIVGIGIGVASLTTPIYIAEVAEPRMRGTLVTINAFMVTFGQFFAGMVDGIFVEIMPETGWRLMLGLAAIPGLIMYYGFQTLPESPRWLAARGKTEEAERVLRSLRDTDEEADHELAQILVSVEVHRDEGESDFGDDDEEEEEAEEDEISLDYGSSAVQLTTAQHRHHHDKSTLSRFIEMLADAPTRRALFLGCGLMVVQQFSGINT